VAQGVACRGVVLAVRICQYKRFGQ
jgi:hypothetical protein